MKKTKPDKAKITPTTPLLDGLTGKIEWEKNFDRSADNLTVKFGQGKILGTFHLDYPGERPEKAYLKEIAQKSIAQFQLHWISVMAALRSKPSITHRAIPHPG